MKQIYVSSCLTKTVIELFPIGLNTYYDFFPRIYIFIVYCDMIFFRVYIFLCCTLLFVVICLMRIYYFLL